MAAAPNLDSILSPLSGVENVDALLSQDHPNYNNVMPSQGNTISYTFDTPHPASGLPTNITYMTAAQKQGVRQALDYVHAETGINFSETSGPAQFFFGYSSQVPTDKRGMDAWTDSYTAAADGTITSLSIWDNILLSKQSKYINLVPGKPGYETLLTGIGFALGLQNNPTLPAGMNNDAQSVMVDTPIGDKSTFGLLDSDALTWIYGNDGLGGTSYASTVSPASIAHQSLITMMTILALRVGG